MDQNKIALTIQKTLNDNGIFPNGSELNAIASKLHQFFAAELSSTVSAFNKAKAAAVPAPAPKETKADETEAKPAAHVMKKK